MKQERALLQLSLQVEPFPSGELGDQQQLCSSFVFSSPERNKHVTVTVDILASHIDISPQVKLENQMLNYWPFACYLFIFNDTQHLPNNTTHGSLHCAVLRSTHPVMQNYRSRGACHSPSSKE